MQDFRPLKVWQKGHQPTRDVYRATAGFPKEEIYGVTSQIRRSAASIPANIAEGCGRSGKAELARFLQLSMGLASELEYHLLLSRDLGFLKSADHREPESTVVEIKRMLSSFIRRLRGTATKAEN